MLSCVSPARTTQELVQLGGRGQAFHGAYRVLSLNTVKSHQKTVPLEPPSQPCPSGTPARAWK